MIFSTSCSRSRYSLLFLGGVFLLLLGACTALRTNGGSSGDRPDPFKVTALLPNREAPQVAETTEIRWEARSAGGVGSLVYAFVLSDGTKEQTVQDGRSPSWMWRPAAAGNYRVKVVVRDEAGNVAESVWSAPYEVVPKLVVEVLYPDRESPQAAESVGIRWEARSAGGVGSIVYAFVLSDGTKEQTVQDSPSPSWMWRPAAAGNYRVKVVARDEAGNVAERSWASDYEILPAFETGATVAVMPMVNLTGTVTPIREIQSAWIGILKARGVRVLEGQILEDFMERHRVRYTGGMTKELGEALKKDTGAQGVLFTSLDLYMEPFPPKVALTARLVYAGRSADILWMDSIAIAGNDSPGILGLGLIRDPQDLRERVMDQLAGSLMDFLSGEKPRKSPGMLSDGGKKFRPKEFFGYFQASARRNGPLIVAVLPFQDESRRRYIGNIMMLHFVRHLASLDNVVVVEPGVVRHALLTSRTSEPGHRRMGDGLLRLPGSHGQSEGPFLDQGHRHTKAAGGLGRLELRAGERRGVLLRCREGKYSARAGFSDGPGCAGGNRA